MKYNVYVIGALIGMGVMVAHLLFSFFFQPPRSHYGAFSFLDLLTGFIESPIHSLIFATVFGFVTIGVIRLVCNQYKLSDGPAFLLVMVGIGVGLVICVVLIIIGISVAFSWLSYSPTSPPSPFVEDTIVTWLFPGPILFIPDACIIGGLCGYWLKLLQ